NKNGKPRVSINQSGEGGWEFNFSHSRDVAILALVRGEEVGIDVEYALKPMPDLYDVLQVVCRPAEVRTFQTLPKAWHQQAFFKLWTIKEAYLKALGTGLSREPDTVHLKIVRGNDDVIMTFDASEERGWQFITFEARPGYLATLAMQTEKKIEISRFRFSNCQETGSIGR
ncbi:MAG: 4'-phosphopantetheinyl transferase superfamily protein, partial [Deltaproteobacteria bacterium]|nr:4'-phosphopantetheinyl transferase superfamily protein [Deltaproteobacteria bacterium]